MNRSDSAISVSIFAVCVVEVRRDAAAARRAAGTGTGASDRASTFDRAARRSMPIGSDSIVVDALRVQTSTQTQERGVASSSASDAHDALLPQAKPHASRHADRARPAAPRSRCQDTRSPGSRRTRSRALLGVAVTDGPHPSTYVALPSASRISGPSSALTDRSANARQSVSSRCTRSRTTGRVEASSSRRARRGRAQRLPRARCTTPRRSRSISIRRCCSSMSVSMRAVSRSR